MERKKKLLIILGLILINAYFLISIWARPSRQGLKVIFFDVGQGDASLIMAEDDMNILVDGGPDKSVISKLDKYLPFYDREIDILVLTHPHSDHVLGLVDVLNKYDIGKVLMTGVSHNAPEYFEFLKILKDKKIAVAIIGGRGAVIGEYEIAPNTKMEILYPKESLYQKNIENLNNSSIIFKISYKEKSFLFTGDIENEVEEELIKDNVILKSDVLKIAHHGSSNSSSKDFLNSVSPKIAVISVGKDNDFGMPSFRILQRLKRSGIEILRTDINGDITVETDGKVMSLK